MTIESSNDAVAKESNHDAKLSHIKSWHTEVVDPGRDYRGIAVKSSAPGEAWAHRTVAEEWGGMADVGWMANRRRCRPIHKVMILCCRLRMTRWYSTGGECHM